MSPPASSFASLVERLSEPGGNFGGDNLISNEQSYLHVMPALQQAGVSGGAYVGVGPDQNFSYLAQIQPAMAYLIDLRRDNLLLHLLFKALIRSVFPSGGSRKLPQAVPGYYSVSLVQPFRALLADLAAGKYRSYRDLIRAGPP